MFRPLPGLTIATGLALVILVGLGIWQLERRTEKHALLDQIAARSAAAPAPVEILFATGNYAAFRHATAMGAFDHHAESYVFAPRADDVRTGQGYKVITPFHLVSGGAILVDRGWVPAEQKDPAARPKGQTQGEIEIAGTLRPSSQPGAFTPPPDAAARVFYLRDGGAIAQTLGVKLTNPLILEATTRAEGGPEPLPPVLNIPDNHLQYALTWFALAIVLIVIYLRFHYVRGRLRVTR